MHKGHNVVIFGTLKMKHNINIMQGFQSQNDKKKSKR